MKHIRHKNAWNRQLFIKQHYKTFIKQPQHYWWFVVEPQGQNIGGRSSSKPTKSAHTVTNIPLNCTTLIFTACSTDRWFITPIITTSLLVSCNSLSLSVSLSVSLLGARQVDVAASMSWRHVDLFKVHCLAAARKKNWAGADRPQPYTQWIIPNWHRVTEGRTGVQCMST